MRLCTFNRPMPVFWDKSMRDNPDHWRSYYTGRTQDVYLSRKFSLPGRSSYCWQVPMVKETVAILLKNLGQLDIPLTLLSQYLPRHYLKIRKGRRNIGV